MWLATTRFGSIEVREEEIIRFTRPLLGFEERRSYFLLPLPGNPAFTWLQSAEEPGLAFLLVDPFLFFAGYQVELTPGVERELEIEAPPDVLVYAVVTLPADISMATANLVAPVILNLKARRGCQVVLEGTTYKTRHLLFPRRTKQSGCALAK